MFDPLQHLRVTPAYGQVKCAIIISLRDVIRVPLAREACADADVPGVDDVVQLRLAACRRP
jgi:hypothetical protein